jgi:hypothetical protein
MALPVKEPSVRYLDTMLDGDAALLEAWLKPRLDVAREVGIRTGFLTVPGVHAVTRGLSAVLDRGGRVCMIAGGQGEQWTSTPCGRCRRPSPRAASVRACTL